MKHLYILLISVLILQTVQAQPSCVTFQNTDSTFGTISHNNIIYSESGIDFRFINGNNFVNIPMIIIDSLNSWNGINGSDNFVGHKLFWGWAETHVLLNNISFPNKRITFDNNSYNGVKIEMAPIQVWAQGAHTIAYDTTSLTNGTIVTIEGQVDSFKVGAFDHNDFVIDNLCVTNLALSTNNIAKEVIKLFPNPAQSTINLTNDLSNAELTIYNLQGVIVKKQAVNDKGMTRIDISDLATSPYFVILKNNTESRRAYFIKE